MRAGSGQGAVPVYHLLTPGDHFSPRTGSAIPTVVDGMCRAAARAGTGGRWRQRVVVQDDTWRPRYDSAEPLEYAGARPPTFLERVVDAGLARLGVPRRAGRRWFGPAAAALATAPPGIVVAHNAPVMPLLLAGGAHRVVLYAHNDILRSLGARERERVVEASARMVCVSEALAEVVRSQLPTRLHARIAVVRNGVDADVFTPAAAAPERPKVVFVGRLIPEKAPDVLLEAAAAMTRQEVEVQIVGSYGFDPDAAPDAYAQRLHALAERMPGRVTFTPSAPRGDMPAILQSATALVVPSRWLEPCPLTIGEGLAAGLVVVGARRGGIPELLGDAGLLFEPDRPAELTAILDGIAADPARAADLRRRARALAEKHDWSWTWHAFEDVLDEVAA